MSTGSTLARHPGDPDAASWWMFPGFYVLWHRGGLLGSDEDVLVLSIDHGTGWALVTWADGRPNRAFVVPARQLRFAHLWIRNTNEPRRQRWPAGTFVQGGDRGAVFTRRGGYVTAFVEVGPPGGGFIRGEGPNVECAERVAWLKYAEEAACPGHEYEPRGYTNGAGFCRHCGRFGSHAFTGEQLGQHCSVCGVGTTYGQYSPDAYWDPDQHRIINPGPREDRVWRCEEHAPCRAEWRAYMDAMWGALGGGEQA